MKKQFLFFVFLFTIVHLKICGQNLVPNGSFETLDGNCPGADSFYLGRPQYWTGYYPVVGGVTIDLSADYFSPCATVGTNYPGLNEAGCALPLDGKSYCGFVASAANLSSPFKDSEYLMNQNISLVAGTKYYVEFYVKSAEGGIYFPSSAYSKNIGAFFIPTSSVSSLANGQTNGLNNISITKPQIPNTFPAQNFYTSSGWQKISGTFTPATTGTWTIVIGNFDPGMNTIVSKSCGSVTAHIATPNLSLKNPSTDVCQKTVAAYYFVDAVTIIPANQTPPNYTTSISGKSTVCQGSSSVYTLNKIPFGASVSWIVTPTSLFSGPTSGSGPIATLSAAGVTYGDATLTYTLTSDCGTTSVPKDIWVGSASNTAGLSVIGSSTPAPGGLYNYRLFGMIPSDQGPLTYTWSIPQDNGWSFFSSTLNSTTVDVWVGTTEGAVQASWTNGCGSTGTYLWVTPTSGGGGPAAESTINLGAYPNPTSSNLHVQVSDSHSKNKKLDQPYELLIVDKSGTKIYTTQSTEQSMTISLEHLPPGIYYLNLRYKNELLQKQIVVAD